MNITKNVTRAIITMAIQNHCRSQAKKTFTTCGTETRIENDMPLTKDEAAEFYSQMILEALNLPPADRDAALAIIAPAVQIIDPPTALSDEYRHAQNATVYNKNTKRRRQ